jgi:hypothetical protein
MNNYSTLDKYAVCKPEYGYNFVKAFLVLPYLSIYLLMALQPFVGPWPLFSFLILYTIGRIPWTGDQPVARPLPIHRTQIQNKRTQTSMAQVGFEPPITVIERAKTVHALDRAATLLF